MHFYPIQFDSLPFVEHLESVVSLWCRIWVNEELNFHPSKFICSKIPAFVRLNPSALFEAGPSAAPFQSPSIPSSLLHRRPLSLAPPLRSIWCSEVVPALHGRRRSFRHSFDCFSLSSRASIAVLLQLIMALESGSLSCWDQRRMAAARWLAVTAELASLLDIVYFVKPIRNSKDSHIFQIFDVHEGRNAGNETQFRLTLADGHNLQRAVLTPELNQMVKNMQLVMKSGSIVRIREYSLYESVHQEQKRLIKIHDMDVPMVKFDLIERPQDYFTWPGQDEMEWKEPEDWEEANWERLDPEDPQIEWPVHDFE